VSWRGFESGLAARAMTGGCPGGDGRATQRSRVSDFNG